MDQKKSRRAFLAAGLLTTAAVACNSKKSPFTPEDDIKPSGEKVKLLSVDGEVIEVDKAFLKPVPHLPPVSNSEARQGIPGKKFVMVIDLARCKNVKACQASCNHAHHIADAQNWIKVYPMKDAEHTANYWQPTTCMHCDEPPCVKVCPVDATYKRQDGLVLIDNERCIGCKFCMAACPYSTRVFNWAEPDQSADIKNMTYSAETGVPARVGTVEKCDFCPDRAREGQLPPCVEACPNGVFYFGDENEDTVTNGEETISFKQIIKDRAAYRFMEELGTKPRVYYLPPKDRQFLVERGYENLDSNLKKRFEYIMEPEKTK